MTYREIMRMIFSASGSPSYKLLFGGVLGQELTDTIRQDEDISAAIQVHKHSAVVPGICI